MGTLEEEFRIMTERYVKANNSLKLYKTGVANALEDLSFPSDDIEWYIANNIKNAINTLVGVQNE